MSRVIDASPLLLRSATVGLPWYRSGSDHCNWEVAIEDSDRPPGPVGREVVLHLPPEAVWESLTQANELSSWLGSDVELDPRPGGVLRLQTGRDVRRGVVEAVRPPEYLAFRWRPMLAGPHGPVPGPGTRVEFFLEPDEGGTRLRVVEAPLSAPQSFRLERAWSARVEVSPSRVASMGSSGAAR